mmetsp:Transcript_12323/g.29055  ORF Transcript_12323/g.29055 Transcript_12323/m.29055 type:complete len:95 (-) Transcript_12323:18-302(-)
MTSASNGASWFHRAASKMTPHYFPQSYRFNSSDAQTNSLRDFLGANENRPWVKFTPSPLLEELSSLYYIDVRKIPYCLRWLVADWRQLGRPSNT